MKALTLTRPSNFERRVLCPGSDREESKVPEPPSSPRAERGTRIHAHLEELVKATTKKRPALLKAKLNGDEEPRLAAQAYRDLTKLAQAFFDPDDDVRFYSEEELSLESLGFDLPAHVDVAVVGTKLTLIADLKSGVWGYSPDSWQMRTYALAAWEKWQSEEFVLAIIQPESDDPVRWVKVDASTLAAWAVEAEAALEACRREDAPVVPSDNACKFCRAVGSCPAYTKNDLKSVEPVLAELDLKSLSLPEFVRLASPEMRASLLESAGRMAKWLEALDGELEAAATEGFAVAGYEVRSAKNDKVWADEAVAVPRLLELCKETGMDQAAVRQPMKWVSPAQALKLFPDHEAKVKDLIVLRPSKPSLRKVK